MENEKTNEVLDESKSVEVEFIVGDKGLLSKGFLGIHYIRFNQTDKKGNYKKVIPGVLGFQGIVVKGEKFMKATGYATFMYRLPRDGEDISIYYITKCQSITPIEASNFLSEKGTHILKEFEIDVKEGRVIYNKTSVKKFDDHNPNLLKEAFERVTKRNVITDVDIDEEDNRKNDESSEKNSYIVYESLTRYFS